MVLALLLSVPGGEATDQRDTAPRPYASSTPTQENAGERQSERPSSATNQAGEALAGLEFSTPASWLAIAVSVTSVVPLPDALDAPFSTNVTVTFSEEIDPTTVTVDSFRLLGPDLSPVSAQVSVGPSGLRATLDPVSALGSGQLHTVELTAAVQSAIGQALTPFMSQFETTADPPQEELPEISDEAAPPPNATRAKTGSAVSAAGDLNNDGFDDFIAGAPGLEVGGEVEAGAALVYFGSDDADERKQPDIIFEGLSAHDRTGVSVAGNFDFNNDGVPDLLIGAEQVNRSGTDDPDAGCDDGVPCGSGKVYLIYFDPLHYPNINDPSEPDIVDLSLVGGAIPGVVFTGARGDQIGFDVAGGGRFDVGIGQDLAIGAPGTDPGTPVRAEAGAVYVIFDPVSLSGTVALDRVGSGLADEIPGVIYLGAEPGDNLGSSVTFPGDVTGTINDDLAMGAPGADVTDGPPLLLETTFEEAGRVYIPAGGNLVNGIIESDDIGTGQPGAQVEGNQNYMEFGESVSGGGDNLVNGEDDLLIGAPGYDADDGSGGLLEDVGLVAQTASKLDFGTYSVSMIGADPEVEANALDGVIYVGTVAGDQLGTTVAGLGDVTGDGFDDVAFGAPFFDPLVDGSEVDDAGAVYLVEGLVPASLDQGVVEVSAIGDTVAGQLLVGTEVGENAGSALAEMGDMDKDGDIDFVVGAPGRDWAPTEEEDAGTIYVVLQTGPVDPDNCGPLGCTVADLDTGAQIVVPLDALTEEISLSVEGILNPLGLPVAPPAGMTVLGTADFNPEEQGFGAPLPTIHVPIRPEIGGQFAGGEQLGLWYFFDGDWIVERPDGTVEPNPHYSDRMAVRADVDLLHFYAVFIDDVDGDHYWDANDSDPSDRFVCADTDGDGCDDCSTGVYDPPNDGPDADGDGICDQGDTCSDFDGDGVGNGSLGNIGCLTTSNDSNDSDPMTCTDDDGDGCDDCSSGSHDPADDGDDTDLDGLCDLGDPDDDNDGVGDGSDSDPLNPDLCEDLDADGCDDCAIGTDDFGPLADNDPADDGTDTDSDGACDAGDPDDDNDGVEDIFDSDPLNPDLCEDLDADGCDDCAVGTDDFGPLGDNDPGNDGTDTDSDGVCNIGDPNDDNDPLPDELDCLPLDNRHWATPSEVLELRVRQADGTTLISWTAPSSPGSSLSLVYDIVRSSTASDFVTAAECLGADVGATQATDLVNLPPGELACYLARAENACGEGAPGDDPSGDPRAVISCLP